MKLGLSIAVFFGLVIALFLYTGRTPIESNITTTPPAGGVTAPALPAHFVHDKNPGQTGDPASRNHFREYIKDGNFPKLTAAQIAPYVQANHRNAESLLTALQTTGDRAFLREAMEKYPKDPKVAYAALYFGDLSPQEAPQ